MSSRVVGSSLVPGSPSPILKSIPFSFGWNPASIPTQSRCRGHPRPTGRCHRSHGRCCSSGCIPRTSNSLRKRQFCQSKAMIFWSRRSPSRSAVDWHGNRQMVALMGNRAEAQGADVSTGRMKSRLIWLGLVRDPRTRWFRDPARQNPPPLRLHHSEACANGTEGLARHRAGNPQRA
ncbi:hypothetical protein SAMN05216228_101571 [Rhizobium tibeticum]|uniref:Uncharacterized protein n=1 Tax=Rhizobium tibeticum TaxID=501024 RepID=A0A1H8NTD7_9HYPH|nr:hypothetical protein RTCCBAU85039_3637 [Rhizobium tibeticum]SEO32849.1 hypothetical protein SAMN05216228_101571 [Rhizobium tibeticum]